ncbi:hypothetical protein NJBCHELONAE_43870 [Mycobacteroides chelonae]|uniref:hypothetical protein n=1 Tax=Mycobacteroides chelonae TaxID=1774 RepID=UPI0021DD22CD|nr:hypothetical protein [Mycobacteroides chelonae]GLE59076.1 hypothetical protein NJBCHELONAE_43870 [Mycobacteroides chelonae]
MELEPLRNPDADRQEAMAMAQRLLGPRSDEHRDRWRHDLTRRATDVLTDGWWWYKHVWSSGEVVGVAVVLGDHAILAEVGETLESAYCRWAFDLYGPAEGQQEAAAGCPRTKKWFDETAALMANVARGQ